MYCARWSYVGILLACLLVCPLVWSQPEPSESEMAEAVQTLKDTADPKTSGHGPFRSQLQRAQMVLTRSYSQAFPLVVALLDEGDPQIRLNAAIVLAGAARRAKPAPDPYLTALERFAAEPHEAIVVEDSERGLRAAVAAGIDCVVVESEFVRGQDFSAATHRIETLAELPALLAALNA